ncbi:MAG: acyl-CoA dehydrogenase family protein [Microthrixaceae bacterium]
MVVAAVDPELKGRGQASFIVPEPPWSLQGQKYKKHGIRASHTSEVVLEDVRIPGSCLLGGKEKLDEKLAKAREAQKNPQVSSGKQPAMATFEATRPSVAAMAVGIARAATYSTRSTTPRSGWRSAGSIIMNQAIAFMLADMATQIDASRLLVHRAAWLSRNGTFTNAEGSMSKLHAGRTARCGSPSRPSRSSVATATPASLPVERWHRDANHGHLRGHRADPAARDRSGHLRTAHRVAETRRASCDSLLPRTP